MSVPAINMKDADKTKAPPIAELQALRARIAELERLESAQRRTDEALREHEKLADIGRMAARIAHDINNPLAGIKNSFLLLKSTIPAENPYSKYVPLIEEEIERIACITRRMFDLSKSEPEPPCRFAIDSVIRDVVALLESTCRAHGVTTRVEPPEAPVAVYLSEGSVRRVLLSLLQNAIEASREGGVVEINADVAGDHLSMSVSDRGSGIPENVAPHIFEPFFTTKNSRSRAGLGLGLSISRSLVRAMGGTLTFESRPNTNTVFRVVLPRCQQMKGGQDG